MPIGMMPAGRFSAEVAELPPGAVLCLYTDGIPEAVKEGKFYGDERLLGVLRDESQRPARAIGGAILDHVEGFLGNTPPSDDITLLVLKRLS
jgi:serine phosphatase RsbU (regulator of sigma subunit)